MGTTRSPRRWHFTVAIAGAIAFFALVLTNSYFEHRDALPRWRAKHATPQHKSNAPWLIATMSPAGGIGRRIVIRETWQKLYGNASRFDMRFIIANATEPWSLYVEAENNTYGDLLMLPHLIDTRKVANTVKPMEFFKALVGGVLRPYSFVSKIDDDSFLEATTFYDKYLDPLLEAAADNKMQIKPTVFGKHPVSGYTWDYPAGAFYTLTWDLVEAAVQVYNFNGTQGIPDEDALIGKLLQDSGVPYDFQRLPYREAFDFASPSEQTDWAQKNESLDKYWHAMGPGAINVHSLKNNPTYLRVAACFDEGGVKLDEWRKNIDIDTWDKSKSDSEEGEDASQEGGDPLEAGEEASEEDEEATQDDGEAAGDDDEALGDDEEPSEVGEEVLQADDETLEEGEGDLAEGEVVTEEDEITSDETDIASQGLVGPEEDDEAVEQSNDDSDAGDTPD